jgi:hypothetical protein
MSADEIENYRTGSIVRVNESRRMSCSKSGLIEKCTQNFGRKTSREVRIK